MTRHLLALALTLLGCVGCGGDEPPPPDAGPETPSIATIEVTPTNPQLPAGIEQALVATARLSDSTVRDVSAEATWTTSDPSVASAALAIITGVAPGTATVTATVGDVSGSTTVVVTSAVLTAIELSPPSPSLAKGTSADLVATGVFSDSTTQDLTGQVTWSSSSPSIASVAAGHVLALAEGTTTVIATLGTIASTTQLTVTPAVLTEIGVTPPSPSLARGTSVPLTATGVFTDGTAQDVTGQVSWSSSTAVVAVSNGAGTAGRVTALDVGTATVSATLGAIVGTASVTVTPAVLVSIAVSPANASIANGTARAFAATGSYTDASTQDLTTQVVWSSSDTTVAAISNAAGSPGRATSTGTGTTTISAVLDGVTGTATLTVTPATLVSIAVTPAATSIVKGGTRAFTATGTFTDASTQNLTASVTWSSTTASVASISNAAATKGVATALVAGTTMIRATLGAISGQTQLVVTNPAIVAISIAPVSATIAKNATQQFTATGSFDDGSSQDVTAMAVWSAAATAVASVSNAATSKGRATGLGAGTTSITATVGGITGTASLTVLPPALVSIAVTPPNPMAVGGTRQFTATAQFSDGSIQNVTAMATWASSNTAVLGVNATGLASGVAAGTATLSATFGGSTGQTTVTVAAGSHRVFMTSQKWSLGTFEDTPFGTEDFNQKCQGAANSAGLGGTWYALNFTGLAFKAFFSGGSAGQIPVSFPGLIVDMTGQIVFQDQTAMQAGVFDRPIGFDENSAPVPAGTTAWSSTNGCFFDFLLMMNVGSFGTPSDFDVSRSQCGIARARYCIEQ